MSFAIHRNVLEKANPGIPRAGINGAITNRLPSPAFQAPARPRFGFYIDSGFHIPGINTGQPVEKDGWYKIGLSCDGSDTQNPIHNHIGDRVFIKYHNTVNGGQPDEPDKPMVASGVLKDVKKGIHIQNHATGQSYHLQYGKFVVDEFWVKPLTDLKKRLAAPQTSPAGLFADERGLEIKHATYYSHPEMLEFLKNYQKPYGILYQSHKNKNSMLTGLLTVEEISPGYNVIVLTDDDGIKHPLDMNYKSATMYVCEYKPSLEKQGIKIGTIDLPLDTIRTSRAQFAEQLTDEVIRDKKSPFESQALYAYLGKNIGHTKSLVREWYGNNVGQKLINTTSKILGEKHLVLLADPGIASRLGQLVRYVKQASIQPAELTPWALRQAFSTHLGTITVYRGMALSENEAKIIQTHGLISPGLLKEENRRDYTKSEYDFISQHPDRIKEIAIENNGEQRGNEEIQKVIRHLGEKYLVFLVDGKLRYSLDRLLDYVKEQKLNPDLLTPLALKQKYLRDVFEEDCDVPPEPDLSRNPIDGGKIQEVLHHFLARERGHGQNRGYILDQFNKRINAGQRGDCDYDSLSSCSTYEPIASTVGWYDSNRMTDPLAKPYTLKLELPVLSVLEQKGFLANKEVQDQLISLLGESFDIGAHTFKTRDPNVELFIPFIVNPKRFTLYETPIPPRILSITSISRRIAEARSRGSGEAAIADSFKKMGFKITPELLEKIGLPASLFEEKV